jgi:hypothetical protein
MERFVVRVMGIAQRCNDLPIRLELMRAADELVEIIEGRKLPEDSDKPRH